MFTVLDHPLIGVKMTTLRDQHTPPQQFRRTLHEIAGLMSFHVFAHLRCDERDVGKVIGKSGKTVGALRTNFNSLASKEGRKAIIEVVD